MAHIVSHSLKMHMRTRSQLRIEKASMSSFIFKSKSQVGRSSIWGQKRSRSPVFECVFYVFRGDLSSHRVAEGCSPKVVAARQRKMENSGHRAAKRVTLCHKINTCNSTKCGVFALQYGHWLPFRPNERVGTPAHIPQHRLARTQHSSSRLTMFLLIPVRGNYSPLYPEHKHTTVTVKNKRTEGWPVARI